MFDNKVTKSLIINTKSKVFIKFLVKWDWNISKRLKTINKTINKIRFYIYF